MPTSSGVAGVHGIREIEQLLECDSFLDSFGVAQQVLGSEGMKETS